MSKRPDVHNKLHEHFCKKKKKKEGGLIGKCLPVSYKNLLRMCSNSQEVKPS